MLISRFPNNHAEMRINDLETKFSTRLPQDYRQFLIKYNGGDTPNKKYKAAKISFDLRGFFGFGAVRYSFDNLSDLSDWITQKQFPIACDSFGNYILISLENGAISFADHERSFQKSFVCDSFTTFVANCKSTAIDKRALRPIQEREADLIAKGRGHVITVGLRKLWQQEIDKYAGMEQEEVSID